MARGDFAHVRALKVMDACNLEFAEASFDVVTLPFVITLIPDAEKLLAECARVLRPEGQIAIVSKLEDGGVCGEDLRKHYPLLRAVSDLPPTIGWTG